ncbi:MAG TPA: AIR synthase-related protein, partial [Phototrophicaceae bacterium]|nr:AIR synthase-related protein [Phototrophicaceae bacterium]
GVIRDVLGVSARPIANTDILCFGMPDVPRESLPTNVLHPRRIADGVIAGIEDYGNKMGIPTVNGAILYHPGYTSNPLVFCGSLGILPHGSHRSQAQPGDLVVVIGGRTGRDGLRGATFSSMEMDNSTAALSGGAVQIGNPIQEKQVQEVVLRARDEELYTSITDCGAGGLSSAVGEMGAEIGATIQLADVPLKYPGLRPWEIWLSEAQERMVLAVPSDKLARLQTIAAGQDVEAVVIGTFAPTGKLTLNYGEKQIGELSMHFLHDGIPTRNMQAVWTAPVVQNTAATGEAKPNFTDSLLKLLALPTIRSKEDTIRKYDHEVQTGTAIKPLVGVDAAGPGDASVIVPLDTVQAKHYDSPYEITRGFVLSNGICPLYTEHDPYAMAWAAIDEAMRNLVAVGADPDQVAILDNFCWGNTQMPDRLGSLVRCSQGCYDAAVAYDVPFISGKDSLNNEYLGDDGQRHAIPGTLLISAVGIVPDVNKTVTMDLKTEGNLLYLIGESRDEFGGSHYHLLHGQSGGVVPQPVPGALKLMRGLYQAIQKGLVQSCHDLSEGGLAVTLAEMCIAGQLGAELTIPEAEAEKLLFSESSCRFVVEVRTKDAEAFTQLVEKADYIGRVTYKPRLVVRRDGGSSDEQSLVYAKLDELESAWRGTLPKTRLTRTVPDTRRETLLVGSVVSHTKAP